MHRRKFLQLASAATASAAVVDTRPSYRVVSAFARSPHPGMPGPFPDKVVRVHGEKSISLVSCNMNMKAVRGCKCMQITIRDVENRNVVELGLAGKNQTGIYGWVQKGHLKWERTGDVPHT